MLPLSKNHAPKIAKRSADNSRKTIMRANWQELKEERKMCEALRELFADDLRESKEEGIMEGRNVGKLEGKLEGAASKVIEIVIKKYKKGCSVKETADMLEEPVSRIRQIYDVIEKNAPDYDAETIYKQLREKEE
jgi:predicted transposase YdaD